MPAGMAQVFFKLLFKKIISFWLPRILLIASCYKIVDSQLELESGVGVGVGIGKFGTVVADVGVGNFVKV